ncbi:DUF664 domain-containing protein [Actinomycetes bacterium KLBMP 9797]
MRIMTEELREPSATAGEAEMLLFALDRSRAQFAWKTGGLDAGGLGKPHPPSTMTLGGLLKHLAHVEDYYTARDVTGQPIGAPWHAVDFDAEPDWSWRTAADDSPEALYALWRGAVARTRTALAAALADGGLERRPKLRRLLVDLHDEYARHVGHADLLREAIDGVVGEDPPQ